MMTNLKEIVRKLSKEAKFEKKILNVRYQKSVAKTVILNAIEIVRFSKKNALGDFAQIRSHFSTK